MDYLTLKLIHIVSSTLLFGTGLGTAFFMVRANISKDIATLQGAATSVVLADWLFTTPSVIIQPLSGYYLMKVANYAFDSIWFYLVVGLFLLAGICWVPVVFIQMKLKAIALSSNTWNDLDGQYFKLYKIWMGLGVPAFLAVLALFYLMVFKPFM